MLLTFTLLGLAIALVWVPDIGYRSLSISLWVAAFIAAIASGLAYGLLSAPGILALGALFTSCLVAKRAQNAALRATTTLFAALLALGLALHVVPGFNNPVVSREIRLGLDSQPYTQYANFDKAAAGLILLAFFARRVTTFSEARKVVVPTVIAIILTAISVIVYALAAGYVRFDPKIPAVALTFLSINLLFTCVAEEVFFRGLVQERLMHVLSPNLHWVAVALSAGLFGLAHFAGGVSYVVLATIGGIGYSLVYARTRRVEPAVLTHFGVNAIHFFGFTYPHLAK